MATRSDVAAVMLFLGSATGKEATADQLEAYNLMLSHLPPDILEAAARRAVAGHEYPTIPPVGVILRHARDLTDPPILAIEAWGMIKDVIKVTGLSKQHQGLAMLPPRVADAAKKYGWKMLCDVTSENQGTTFSQFSKAYEAIADRDRFDDSLPEELRLPPAVTSLAGKIGAMPALGGR